jgi:FkbM family methyltransferase
LKFLKKFYWTYFKRRNFSQAGEEDFLINYFPDDKGFYLDIGCHDPFRYSNTQSLYKKGWNGINIDSNPDVISKFNKYRKRDTNICALISNATKPLEYSFYNDHALNGVHDDKRKDLLKKKGYRILKTETINTITLNRVLEENKCKKIDLINIDVEGHELEVLSSINLDYYFVELIMVEENNNENDLKNLLEKYNYFLLKRIDRNLIFKKKFL